jgi:hypothetical protein
MGRAASPRVIEVHPADGAWAVEVAGRRVRVLAEQAEAVAFACLLSDEMAMNGPAPRIRVHFRRGWRLEPRALPGGSSGTAIPAISRVERND